MALSGSKKPSQASKGNDAMRKCTYCGTENKDSSTECKKCKSPFVIQESLLRPKEASGFRKRLPVIVLILILLLLIAGVVYSIIFRTNAMHVKWFG
jgi:uncharacterized membrane protein YvbJ